MKYLTHMSNWSRVAKPHSEYCTVICSCTLQCRTTVMTEVTRPLPSLAEQGVAPLDYAQTQWCISEKRWVTGCSLGHILWIAVPFECLLFCVFLCSTRADSHKLHDVDYTEIWKLNMFVWVLPWSTVSIKTHNISGYISSAWGILCACVFLVNINNTLRNQCSQLSCYLSVLVGGGEWEGRSLLVLQQVLGG